MTDLHHLPETATTHLTCGNCGADVEPGDVMCATCGALLAAYQIPSGSSVSSAAIIPTDMSPEAITPNSTTDSEQHDVYTIPASLTQPETTLTTATSTTSITGPAGDGRPVADATLPENHPQAAMPRMNSAPRVLFPAPSDRPPPEPKVRPSSSDLDQSPPPKPVATRPPEEKRRPRTDRPVASIQQQQPQPQPSRPVRQPVISKKDLAEPIRNSPSLPTRDSIPPVRLPQFSGRDLGRFIPFALIALVIITRVPGITALLGLLAVIGVAGLFLAIVMRAARGTRRRTTDMPRDRDYYRKRNRRRRGR